MGLKAGYKQTEVGWLPVRWELKRLGQVTTIIPGGIYGEEKSRDALLARHVATTAHIDEDDTWNSKEMNVRYFTQEEVGRYSPIEGDLIVVKSSGSAEKIQSGKIGFVDSEIVGQFLFSNFLMLLRPTSVVSRFLYFYLCSYNVKKLLPTLVEASTYPNIRIDEYLNLRIPIPPDAEQRAIAGALSDVDALLGALSGLIAKKRNLKQDAMQQLLTGQTRLPGFSGEWEVKQFSRLFQFLSTANNPRADLAAFGDVAYIHYGDIHTTNSAFLNCSQASLPFIAKEHVVGIPFVEEGDLVMADASEDYAGIGKSVETHNVRGRKIVAGLHTFLLRGDKELLADGFKGYLQFIPSVKGALIRLATGISVYGVSKNSVRSVEIQLPKVAEQAAIAAVLSDMEAEIAGLEQRLAKTRDLKQGMMQELLMGRKRLV